MKHNIISSIAASDGTPNPALSADAAGQIGVGTVSPDTPLHVLGDLTIQGASAGKYKLQVTGNGTTSSDLSVIDVYNGSSYMFLDRFKQLGLSTVTPQEKLQVNDGNIFFTSYLVAGGERANSSYIAFKGANDGTLNRKSAMIEIKHNESVNFSTDMHFHTTDTTNSMTAKLSVLNNGYVGVGTIGPAYKLDVRGAAHFGNDAGTVEGYIYTKDNTLNFLNTFNSDQVGYINHYGYNGGATQFRDLQIGDGKGGAVVYVDGSATAVGIGTVSPVVAVPLTLQRDNSEAIAELLRIRNLAGAAVGTGGSIRFTAYRSGAAEQDFGSIKYLVDNIGVGTEQSTMQFFTQSAGTFASRIAIQGSYVGVGTTAPVYPFTTAIGYAKTDTGYQNTTALVSNESLAAHPAGLIFQLRGHASSQASRVALMYTQEMGIANDGILSLQPFGGKLGVGTDAPTEKLTVAGAGAIGDAVAASSEASSIPILNKIVGYAADAAITYILLCRTQTAAGTFTTTGFDGELYFYRGSTTAGNNTHRVSVAAKNAYSAYHATRFNSDGGVALLLVTCYVGGVQYLALQTGVISACDIYASGRAWGAYPTVVAAGSVSSVVNYAQPYITTTTAGAVGIGTNSPSSMLDVAGDIETGSTNAFYFGDPTTDGTWKMVRNGSNLEVQVRVSGSYVAKTVIAP